MEKKQNSVEWLIRIVQSCIAPNYIPQEIIKQAKAMHKEEMRELYLGHVTKVPRLKKIFEKQFEEYYTNTFE